MVDRTIVFTDVAVAREAVALFAEMNRDWWAGPTEAYIYNEFADALREGFRLGVLHQRRPPRPTTPTSWPGSQAAGSPLIAEKLDHILHFRPERIDGFVPRVIPKTRWLDPPVRVGDDVQAALGSLVGRHEKGRDRSRHPGDERPRG